MMLLLAEYANRMPIMGIQKTLRRRHSRAGGNDGGWLVFVYKRTQKGRLKTNIVGFAKSFSDDLKSTDCSTLFILLFGRRGCGDTRNIFCFSIESLISYWKKFQAAFDFSDRFLD